MAAHHETIKARQAVAVVDDPNDPAAGPQPGRSPHEQLQHAVAAFYEVIRAHLVETPEGQRYFHGEIPDDPTEEGYGVLAREEQIEEIALEDLAEPPEDVSRREALNHYEAELAELEREGERFAPPANFYEADGGTPVVEARFITYKAGLRRLDDLFDQRVEVKIDDERGPLGTRSSGNGFFPGRDREADSTEIQLQLRPLRELINAARELDRAGSELDLLAETKESELKPHMREFDASNGETPTDVAHAEVSGSPDV